MTSSAFAALALVGASIMSAIGWYVQLVQYPSFRWVSEVDFPAFHHAHVRGTGFVVIPGMLLELVGAVGLWDQSKTTMTAASLALTALALGLTFAVSAPIHARLTRSHSVETIERLINTNLPRTLAWTAHMLLLITQLVQSVPN